jgi:hypothetical protein
MNILADIMYPDERVPTRSITRPFIKWVRGWLESAIRHYGWSTTVYNKELIRLYELSLQELAEEMKAINEARNAHN